MVSANLGSIAATVYTRIDGISTNVSGLLIPIADEQRLFMEEFTGLAIGSVGIADRFQPALIDLTTAQALNMVQLEGGDFNMAQLGEFQIKKGLDSNLTTAASAIQERGMDKLKIIGRKARFTQALS